MDFEKHNMLTM